MIKTLLVEDTDNEKFEKDLNNRLKYYQEDCNYKIIDIKFNSTQKSDNYDDFIYTYQALIIYDINE